MRLTEIDDWQGQPGYRIETPGANWVYHRTGAGFASLVDPDGNDWISHRPGGGSAGEYRGIPNVIHPEGGFHPGAETCASELVEASGDRVVIASASCDGRWACRWTILPDRAVMDLERVGHPYWILYEGTPGGEYDESRAFMVDSSGRRGPANSTWERRLPEPRWIYFGTPSSPCVLYLIDHTPRPAGTLDSYWSMEGNMTVFGFGRVLDSADPRWHHLTEVPARLTVGLLHVDSERDMAERLNEIAATGR
jgi:hypothetical protein